MIQAFSAYYRDPNVKFKDQERDETVLLLLRRHFVTNVWWVLTTAALALVPLVALFGRILPPSLDVRLLPADYILVGVLVWYLFALGFVIINFLDWFFNVNLITSKRVVDMDYTGLLFFNVSETNYANIQDVTYHVGGLLQVLFNYGTVLIQTAGTNPNFELLEIPKPSEVHDLLTDLMGKPVT